MPRVQRSAGLLVFALLLALIGCGGSGPTPTKITATFYGNTGTIIHHGERVQMNGAAIGHVIGQKVIPSPVSEDGSVVSIRLRPRAPAIPPDTQPVVGGQTKAMTVMPISRVENIKARPGFSGILPGGFDQG